MFGLYVDVPVACFRQSYAREYLSTEVMPSPSTCYGFLLALIGETDRRAHLGCRIGPVLYGDVNRRPSVVLRKVWRLRFKDQPLGQGSNAKPDFQQLHTETKLVVWIDSSEESKSSLEKRLQEALERPESVTRFGGLSVGESTHLVNEFLPVESALAREEHRYRNDAITRRPLLGEQAFAYLLRPAGARTLPVWVDHVGSAKTVFAVGDYVPVARDFQPEKNELPKITEN